MKPITDTLALLNSLLDDHKTAIKLGLAATVRKSRCTGILLGQPAPRFIRIGKTIRYRESDLQAWLDQFSTFANTAEESKLLTHRERFNHGDTRSFKSLCRHLAYDNHIIQAGIHCMLRKTELCTETGFYGVIRKLTLC